ncbi:MAG: class IV adenylate cyclase [Planctomycetota bacterium]
MKNIEIKAYLPDRQLVESLLEECGARFIWTRKQRDTFYRTELDWLKLREETPGAAELIAYKRDTSSARARPNSYERAPIEDLQTWQRLLGRVLRIQAVVEKERSLWLFQNTRIHLDRVTGLGEFLELETVLDGISEAEGQKECAQVIALLRLRESDFIARPYRDLLAEQTDAPGS